VQDCTALPDCVTLRIRPHTFELPTALRDTAETVDSDPPEFRCGKLLQQTTEAEVWSDLTLDQNQ
jgi:hypothetical protein